MVEITKFSYGSRRELINLYSCNKTRKQLAVFFPPVTMSFEWPLPKMCSTTHQQLRYQPSDTQSLWEIAGIVHLTCVAWSFFFLQISDKVANISIKIYKFLPEFADQVSDLSLESLWRWVLVQRLVTCWYYLLAQSSNSQFTIKNGKLILTVSSVPSVKFFFGTFE